MDKHVLEREALLGLSYKNARDEIFGSWRCLLAVIVGCLQIQI